MKRVFSSTIAAVMLFGMLLTSAHAADITCLFPPDWSSKTQQAQDIAKALSDKSGLTITSQIAKSYPEIIKDLADTDQHLVYVGSFVQAIIKAKNIGTPMVQAIDGKEFYCGVLVYVKGRNPDDILKNSPADIAFAKAASSGETAAKAATDGKANLARASHDEACKAVITGRAQAAVVKNWWWEKNKDKFPTLDMYKIPGISVDKNPDNVLTASKSIPADVQAKIAAAAIASSAAFGAQKMVPFDPSKLAFPLEMMKKGNIDPNNYTF